jgi:hypothetical protein
MPIAQRTPPCNIPAAAAAARDLPLDPVHHTWVRTHWGDDYLHRENFFFRSLLIAGLTSYEALTRDGSARPMLRDQVETLSTALDKSELGLIDDYPGECYPIDVVAGIGFIRRADAVLGTDHSRFVARSLRAFEGPMADELGLVRVRVDLPSGSGAARARTDVVGAVSHLTSAGTGTRWYARHEASRSRARWAADLIPRQAACLNDVEIDGPPMALDCRRMRSVRGRAPQRAIDHATRLH